MDQAVDLSTVSSHPDLPSSTQSPGLAVAKVMAASRFAAETGSRATGQGVALAPTDAAVFDVPTLQGVDSSGDKERVVIPVKAAAAKAAAPPGSAITPHLVALLQSFRSTVSRSKASQLLANIPTSLESFSVRDFAVTWASFVEEVSDVFMQQERLRAEKEEGLMGRRYPEQATSPSSSGGVVPGGGRVGSVTIPSQSPASFESDWDDATLRIEDLLRRVQGYVTAVAYCRPNLLTRVHNMDLRALAASPAPQQQQQQQAAPAAAVLIAEGRAANGKTAGAGAGGKVAAEKLLEAVDGDEGGYELTQEMSFWRGVAARLDITPQQKRDLLEAYHLYGDVLKRVTAEQV